MSTAFKNKIITVADVAIEAQRTPARIRQIAIEHKIGNLLNPNLRIFTRSEAKRVLKILESLKS